MNIEIHMNASGNPVLGIVRGAEGDEFRDAFSNFHAFPILAVADDVTVEFA